jgi:cyclopropane-fatty-acyl-phospholipid synthase
MNSRIYVGTLSHARTREVSHGFDYDLHLYALDMGELDQLDCSTFWFGHNRIRPVALHDRDYLYRAPGSLRDKVLRALRENGVDLVPGRIVLVTALRQFHYVFNPASFFYCYDNSGRLACVLVQVNNTFGETHLYVLTPQGDEGRFAAEKAFHVSPFFPRRGRYEFMFSEPGDELGISITYFLDDAPALTASFAGQARPMTGRNMAAMVLGHPLRAAMTFPRIVAQAARLYFGKKLSVHPKPEPISPMTIRHASPTLLESLAKLSVRRFLARLDHGQLTLRMPDESQELFGKPESLPRAELDVHRNRFFQRVMLWGDIGFGEAYAEGDWSSPDLVGLLCLLAQREEVLDDRRFWPALAGRALNYAAHLRRPNSVAGSRRNIGEHYDLGNDFYRLFLDSTMSYSGGIFKTGRESLEESQRAKMQAIIDMARLGPDDHVLEIGCGWGGFALEAARSTGCRVTGITISREQFDWATRRVREEGLEDRIEILLTDYRHVRGSYSAIVSIEMLEAVGHRNLPLYFQTLDRLLAAGGRAALQVITMPDQKYDAYRLGSDWIRKHIFPGGHLPSIGAMARAMGKRTRLGIVRLEDIGTHYARTLELWRQALLARTDEVRGLGFDGEFLRKWEYYLSYCEAGFRSRTVRNYQFLLSRMGEPEGLGRL